MIRLSPAAIHEVNRLKGKHLGTIPGVLRVSIQPKGCAGLSYQLDFAAFSQPDDQVFECEAIQVVVQRQSLPYVDGLVLDYSEDLMGGSFRFHNPNAKQTCSCGHSFAIETGT
jgi:iron-sulfur cluster assembly accessory protein